MQIKSDTVTINASQQEVYDFVKDLNNFEQLLPADKVENWASTENECSFKIKGATSIDFKVKELDAPGKILLESGSKSPFPFTLDIRVEENNGNVEAYNIFEGNVNPFLKAMIQKPLSNLFNYVAGKIKEKFE